MSATLYLIPNLLSEGEASRQIPAYNSKIMNELKYFIVETPKTARLLLKKCGLKTPFDDLSFYVLNEHTRDLEIPGIIAPLLEGHDMGLITDAGYPVVADPGEVVVRIAQKNHIRVVPLAGPNSVFLALAASGLNAEQFTFHGYLPVKTPERIAKIRELEDAVYRKDYTQVFIETPYRNFSMFSDLVKTLKPETLLCIAMDILSPSESILTKRVSAWRQEKPEINKRLVVFLVGK